MHICLYIMKYNSAFEIIRNSIRLLYDKTALSHFLKIRLIVLFFSFFPRTFAHCLNISNEFM